MSANLFDAGDMQRLEREESLTIQSDRAENRTPDDNIMGDSDDMQFIFDGLLSALQRKLI